MNKQIMNEPMKVELGFIQFFAFLFNPAFWSGVATVGSTAMTANAIISSFNQPGGNSVSIPGMAGITGLSPSISRELQRQQTELERLNQEELQRVEEQKKIDEQKALQQKNQNILVKYGPFVVVGGIVLSVVLLSRRKNGSNPRRAKSRA